MTRPALLFTAAATVFLTVGVYAQAPQAKPDFSGKWTIVADPKASTAFTALAQTFSVAQDAKTLTVMTTDPRVGEKKAVYNLDGSETMSTPRTLNGTSMESRSKAQWSGEKLILTLKISVDGKAAAEGTMTWSLEASGNLVVESTENLDGVSKTTKATFRKGQPPSL